MKDLVKTVLAMQWALDNLDWGMYENDETRRHLKLLKNVRDNLVEMASAEQPVEQPAASPIGVKPSSGFRFPGRGLVTR